MRKLSIIALIILAGLLLMACDEDGELRIRNRTNASVEVAINNGQPMEIVAGSGWSRYYTESTTVTVNYSGNYVLPDSETRTVSPGLPTTVNINATAGMMSITNDSQHTISELYISPRTQTDFGENLITESLLPEAISSWTLTDTAWDVKIVISDGTMLYKMNQPIALNETLELKVSTFTNHAKKTGLATTSKPYTAPIPR